jgi:hypothetical protein
MVVSDKPHYFGMWLENNKFLVLVYYRMLRDKFRL